MRFAFIILIFLSSSLWARTYNVGPDNTLQNISDVSWETLAPGDTVQIHARSKPYHEKWVLCVQGTKDHPIVIRGIPDKTGKLPVINGQNASTRNQLNYWNERRGIIKIGGANTPADTMPSYITIENLDIRSGRPPYTFTGRDGQTPYARNSAAIFIEKGEHITIRNCILSDCGNGLFAASKSSNILVEYCHIYNNGIENRIYEHNNYTEADSIIFQFNRFGPLREGCLGNNLKDRSAGTVIRYNWIKDGNRQLDLVDSDHTELINNPAYRSTYVYGNILIESEGEGNSQIVHYGGDSKDHDRYRKGTLYFYNNTVISTRTDNTTLLRLSSNDETCILLNNILYTTAPGNHFALTNRAGSIHFKHNWIKQGWVSTHDALIGMVNDKGYNLTGDDPGFINIQAQNFTPFSTSPLLNAGTTFPSHHPILYQYHKHRQSYPRTQNNAPDLGAITPKANK